MDGRCVCGNCKKQNIPIIPKKITENYNNFETQFTETKMDPL